MLNDELTRGECDEDEACQFLFLLKRKNSLQVDEIDENEWIMAMKKATRKITSSTFSKSDYSV